MLTMLANAVRVVATIKETKKTTKYIQMNGLTDH